MEQYFPVYRWMARELGVSGNELLIYAIIYSFTENHGRFSGGIPYLADYLGLDKGTVFRTLQRLLKKQLIGKTERFDNHVKYCDYFVPALRDPSAERPAAAGETPTPPLANRPSPTGETPTPPLANRLSPTGETPTPPLANRPSPTGETPTPPLANRLSPTGETPIHNKVYNKQDNKKDSKGEDKSKNPPLPKRSFGEYHNVLLTEEELGKLKREYPEDWRQRIERLSAYMASTGKAYKNHLATIRSWTMRDAQEKREPEKPALAPIPGGLRL